MGNVESDYLHGAGDIRERDSTVYVPSALNSTLVIVGASKKGKLEVLGRVTAEALRGATAVELSPQGGKKGAPVYAYVAAQETNSIVVVDVTQSKDPRLVKVLTDERDLGGVCSLSINESGDTLFAAACARDRVSAIELTNPEDPIISSTVQLSGAHDIHYCAEKLHVASGPARRISVLSARNKQLLKHSSLKDLRLTHTYAIMTNPAQAQIFAASEAAGGTLSMLSMGNGTQDDGGDLPAQLELKKHVPSSGKYGINEISGIKSLAVMKGKLYATAGKRHTGKGTVVSMHIDGDTPRLDEHVTDEQLDRAERIAADHETGTLFVVSPDHPRVVAIATEKQGWF